MSNLRSAWRTLLLAGLLVGVTSLTALAIAGETPSTTNEAPADNRPYMGHENSGSLDAVADVPSGGSSVRAPDGVGEVGVLRYDSLTGLTCLAAGPVQAGRVGQIGKQGFRAFKAEDAPGMCGDFTDNLATYGGIALGIQSASSVDFEKGQAIAFGLVKEPSTKIRVTWSDGTRVTGEVESAERREDGLSFAFAAPPGVALAGTTVELVRASGASHRFEL